MSRRLHQSLCTGKLCADCFAPNPTMVDMTHHTFLCSRCCKSERHSRCNLKSATVAFTPSEMRIVSYMIRSYTRPTVPRKEEAAPAPPRAASIRRFVSLPSVLQTAQETAIDRSQSVLVSPGGGVELGFGWVGEEVEQSVLPSRRHTDV
jgi:hypothetical protein